MKRFIRSCKLFWLLSFNWILALAGAAFTLLILIASAVDPDSPGDDEYNSMLGTIFLMHYAPICSILLSANMNHYKFPQSVPDAKMLFTVTPVIVTAGLCIICDILFTIVAALFWSSESMGDLVIGNSIATVICCFVIQFMNRPKVAWLNLLFIPALFLGGSHIPGSAITHYPVLAIVIYIVGIALAILAGDIWWRKSGRCFNTNYQYMAKLQQQ